MKTLGSSQPGASVSTPHPLYHMMLTALDIIAWSIDPLALFVRMGVMVWMIVWTRLPPFRWAVRTVLTGIQLVVCVQVTFLALTFAKMAWALGCIALCAVSDYVDTNARTATFQAFIQRYYWPK